MLNVQLKNLDQTNKRKCTLNKINAQCSKGKLEQTSNTIVTQQN